LDLEVISEIDKAAQRIGDINNENSLQRNYQNEKDKGIKKIDIKELQRNEESQMQIRRNFRVCKLALSLKEEYLDQFKGGFS
jgi:hypothetical protein